MNHKWTLKYYILLICTLVYEVIEKKGCDVF